MALAVVLLFAGCQPTFTGQQFRDLQNNFEPGPRTTRIGSAPAITGHAGADARIRTLAVSRGYRLRTQHTGTRSVVGGVELDSRAAGALRALIADAARSGHSLGVLSGYRSVSYQRNLFVRRLSGYSNAALASGSADHAIDAALRWVAPPGYSKHHSGFAVDLRAPGGAAFGTSAVGRWIASNNWAAAKRHGFVPSYPPGAGAQGPDPEPWEFVYVGVTTINCGAPLARGDRPGFDDCLNPTPISRKYAALGGASGRLGRVVEAERAVRSSRAGRVARYAGGSIYWSQSTGAHPLWGVLMTEFQNQRGIDGPLGYPSTDILSSSDGTARYSVFQYGRIYFRRDKNRTVTIAGDFHTKHRQLGGAGGVMGYPTHNARTINAPGGGRVQTFDTGRMYQRGGVTRQTHGSIHTAYQANGGVGGRLGYPTSDVQTITRGGRIQYFERGRIYSHPGRSIPGQALWGVTLDRYLANGGHVPRPHHHSLQFPVQGVTQVGDGRGVYAIFESGGRIYGTAQHGAYQVHSGLLDLYLSLGGPQGQLGYPTSDIDPQQQPGNRYQHFENGRILLRPNGTIELA